MSYHPSAKAPCSLWYIHKPRTYDFVTTLKAHVYTIQLYGAVGISQSLVTIVGSAMIRIAGPCEGSGSFQ